MARETTSPSSSNPPRIWDYEDARRFVAHLCHWKQRHEPHFSYRQLARFAELGSPSYVQTYLKGKRNLKPGTARRLGQALGLDEAEQSCFVLLVRYTQQEDERQREVLRLELLRHSVRHGRTGRIDEARLDYFTQWFIPVVHAMASLAGFRPDPHWIAGRLVPRIRSFDARRALDTLLDLGMLTRDDDGGVEVATPRVATDPALRSSLVQEYLRAMVRLVDQAVDAWPRDHRVTSAMTITVPESLIAQLYDRVEGFRRELFDWVMAEQESYAGVPGQVVQINFQAFPVTDLDPDDWKITPGAEDEGP